MEWGIYFFKNTKECIDFKRIIMTLSLPLDVSFTIKIDTNVYKKISKILAKVPNKMEGNIRSKQEFVVRGKTKRYYTSSTPK